ncbi:DUF7674 family protein [Pseudobacter ginsenosidimutans]|uniref:DUF7674 domain-containing protein n=1 Tax=Pseudobacter ginsenosidimutans TaxID=661488 RepID=A0A4Q7N5E6_9BACT|nr:hypothetical protein [Pseudobacter ginsenosidimutans]QEC44779.1 hypothetical protein FSB84_24995 [Pseudobacter ginsenosidimutans]RZS76266.1 hypothetical protein EV199_2146 [Pseudobacter ginsenosidimutans]
MITRYEVPVLLKATIPDLQQTCMPAKASLEIYVAMNSFTDLTRHAVEDHNMNLAKRCFTLAEKLYREGDSLVKLLIENCFVYSFSLFMPKDRHEMLIVESMIPASLYNLYVKQVSASGC